MTKKKPDFLRDLDTAIMDELTGGGIKENAAGLVGTLTQIEEIKQLCGLPLCGYMAKVETVRPSGVPDEVTVVFAEDVPYRACNGIEFDVMQEFVEGSRLLLTGKGISRGDKVKPTKEEQEKVNTRQAERKLRILINANYGYGDYHLVLDYIRRKGEPDRTPEQMRQDIDVFLRECRKEYRKAGLEFKYIRPSV